MDSCSAKTAERAVLDFLELLEDTTIPARMKTGLVRDLMRFCAMTMEPGTAAKVGGLLLERLEA